MILKHGYGAEAARSNQDIETIQARAGGIHAIVIRWLTGLLIFVLCLWMLAGIGELVVGLYGAVSGNWRQAGEHMIVSVLVILALLEIMRTLLAYQKLGRVRVTFIIDTALVVLIGELIGLWFGEYSPQKVLLSLGVIATLVILRNITAGHPIPDS